jgi:WD40 repeat protein
LIGRGSYGEVWLARNVMGTYRAVKVVYRSTFDQDGPYEREFAGIRRFEPISRSQESQVDILHIGRNDTENYFYYVMELADDASGGEFAPERYAPKTLQAVLKPADHPAFAECLRISVALANALNHLHQNGLVHRDIKPSNIIFVNGIPKLADIGLVTESEATITYVGAHGFMPPEGPGRPQGDIYSLGKVIYELCTGRDRLDFPALPAEFGAWPERKPMLELMSISLKACEPEALHRYPSAEELIADLLLVQAGQSIRRLRWLEHHRRWAVAATALALLVIIGAWLVQIENRSRERTRQREVWLREAQMLRLGQHRTGWSSNALQLISQAGELDANDDLRAQAAATLGGVDVFAAKSFGTTSNETRSPTSLTFDHQGRRVLMDGGGDGHVKLWNPHSAQTITFTSTNAGPVWFTRNGSPRQFILAESGVCRLLNLENGQTLREFRAGDIQPGSEAQALAVSREGNLGAVAFVNNNGEEGRIALWELTSGKLLKELAENCTALAIAPDDSCLASGDDLGQVRVRSLPELNQVVSFHQGHATLNCLSFQRDATEARDTTNKYPWLLSVGDSGGTIKIYEIGRNELDTICHGSQFDVYATAFSPDGMTLASAGRAEVKLWDVVTGRNLLLMQGNDYCYALAFSPDGRQLAVGSGSGHTQAYVGTYELAAGRGVAELRGLSSQVRQIAFSHDSQRLAALSDNWEVGLWNTASNQLERVLEAPKGLFADNAALAFNRDDTCLAFATSTDTRLWEVPSGQLLHSWRLPRGLVQKLGFGPTDRLLHFQCERRPEQAGWVCKVRELSSRGFATPLSEVFVAKEPIFDAVLSPPGEWLAIVGPGTQGYNIVKVFSPLTGRELCALPATGNHGSDWLIADPQSTRVGYWRGTNIGTSLYEMPRGEPWRNAPRRHVRALSPDGRWGLANAPDNFGITVFKLEDAAWQLRLGLDHENTTFHSCFSPNGRLLAWGTAEGTVCVCELEVVLARLKAAELGWPDGRRADRGSEGGTGN